MNILIKLLDKICTWPAKLACGLCFLLLLLTLEQVIARYCFQSSSLTLQELQWHFFGAIFTLASAWTFQKDQHVRVDIFYQRWSPRTQAICNIIGHCCFLFPICFILMDYGWSEVELSQSYPNHTPLDHWTAQYGDPQSSITSYFRYLEQFLRTWVIFGEGSSDPGGLPARWISKALIPLCGLLLSVQGLSLLLKDLKKVISRG
jgi:TRAP-type mannitol/chloroaromatic compound transport system permease small subunit